MRGRRGLIGRDADLARVVATVTGEGRCTIVGPGGVGKSALARAVADAVDRQTIWIDTEPLADVGGVADELLRQFGVERLPGESPLAAAVSALEAARLLLVLDGVEHLGDDMVGAVEAMPVSADGLWLLTTTRRPLGPSLRPLVRLSPLPTAGSASPARQLLSVELSARGADAAVLPTDEDHWGRVLAITGGLPAAIELTADYLTRFGARLDAEPAAALDEIVERCVLRTLKLLDEPDRRAFLRLGLTGASFTLDVVSGLSGQSASAARATTGRLIDLGLVFVVGDRLDLLPPVRDGARALLEREEGIGAALNAAVTWAAGIARSRADGSASVLATNLETALHIARLAMDDPIGHPDVVPLVHGLFDPMYRRLRWREQLTLLETLASSGRLSPRDQAETARLAAHCASGCDTIARARYWLDQVHQIAGRLDDRPMQAHAWGADAWLALDIGDHGRAEDAARRSLTLGVGDTDIELTALRAVAETALASGNLDRAEEIARAVLSRSASQTAFDALLARTTLGWCLVERGQYAEAAAHARLLAADSHHDQLEASETSVEAELIAIAADPATEPTNPLLDDQRFSWWMRLEQRIRLSARRPPEEWESVLHAAADVVVLADQVPLAHPRLVATILLGDAALVGNDLRQAGQAYEQALRDAVRAPARLRGADALDGVAALARRTGQRDLEGVATATADALRRHAGAVAWRRPSLPGDCHIDLASRSTVPGGWVRNGQLTPSAVDALAGAIRLPDPAQDPWKRLTHAERQVAQLVREGLSNAEIADRLVVSRRTVESHLSRVFRKLAVRSRTQLATRTVVLPTPDV